MSNITFLNGEFYIGALAISATVILAVLGQHFSRHFLDSESMEDCQEVGGYYLSVVGALYAVLLGLVVVDAMSRFEDGRKVVELEANSMMEVYVFADRFPPSLGNQVKRLVSQYTNEVVDHEWLLMESNQTSRRAQNIIYELFEVIHAVDPITENQKAIYPLLLSESVTLWENRRARANISDYSIHPAEWMILISGGIVTVGFTYFFTIKNQKIQLLMTAMITLIISMNLYLVWMYAEPFTGDMKVPKDPYLIVQDYIQQHP